jgi:hypothetical protein
VWDAKQTTPSRRDKLLPAWRSWRKPTQQLPMTLMSEPKNGSFSAKVEIHFMR